MYGFSTPLLKISTLYPEFAEGFVLQIALSTGIKIAGNTLKAIKGPGGPEKWMKA